MAPGTPSHRHLADLGLNDAISSFQPCSSTGLDGGGALARSGIHRAAADEHNKYRSHHSSPGVSGEFKTE